MELKCPGCGEIIRNTLYELRLIESGEFFPDGEEFNNFTTDELDCKFTCPECGELLGSDKNQVIHLFEEYYDEKD